MFDLPHKYEVMVKEYMSKMSAGEAPPVDTTLIDQACEDFRNALIKQFSRETQDFVVRMSNVGRPRCQLWWQKNHPEKADKPSYDFIMKMLLGDTIEVLSLMIMRAAGVPVESYHGKVELPLKGHTIKGEYDVVIDGKVWDIKSASPFAYEHKFKSFEDVKNSDSFGYVAQGFGYANAAGMPFGGWIVVNKSTGEWKFVEVTEDLSKEHKIKAQEVSDYIATDAPFERCFEDEPEYFRKKATGNRIVAKECSFCDYKFHCWPDLQYKRVDASQAKNKPFRYYTEYHAPTEETSK